MKTGCSSSVCCYSPLIGITGVMLVSVGINALLVFFFFFLSILQCYIICKKEMELFGQNMHLSQKLPEALKLPKPYTKYSQSYPGSSHGVTVDKREMWASSAACAAKNRLRASRAMTPRRSRYAVLSPRNKHHYFPHNNNLQCYDADVFKPPWRCCAVKLNAPVPYLRITVRGRRRRGGVVKGAHLCHEP